MKKKFEAFNMALNDKIQQWMQGRYGIDELSKALYITGFVFLISSLFSPLRFLTILAFAFMLWSCIRCYSKKLAHRRAERDAWLRFTGGIRSWLRLQGDKWRDRKDYRYFRCRECKAPLRVPRGKGRIRIRCPKCHKELDAKT